MQVNLHQPFHNFGFRVYRKQSYHPNQLLSLHLYLESEVEKLIVLFRMEIKLSLTLKRLTYLFIPFLIQIYLPARFNKNVIESFCRQPFFQQNLGLA